MAELERVPGLSAAQKLLVVGCVAYDEVVMPDGSESKQLGGAASFAALASSYFTETQLVSLVGEDFEDVHIEQFRNHEVDLEGLKKVPGKTFFWKGEYSSDLNHRETKELDLGVFEGFKADYPEAYAGARYVVLGNIDPDVQLAMLEGVREDAVVMGDTIDFWIRTKKRRLLEFLQRIDILLIDADEARALTGESNIIIAGERLRTMGPPNVVVKKGEHGALLFHEEGIFMSPAYPVKRLVDPTGAGDTFSGALMGYLAAVDKTEFIDIKRAMLYATATASLCVEGFSLDVLEKSGGKTIQARYDALLGMMQL